MFASECRLSGSEAFFVHELVCSLLLSQCLVSSILGSFELKSTIAIDPIGRFSKSARKLLGSGTSHRESTNVGFYIEWTVGLQKFALSCMSLLGGGGNQ